ncbi:MAG: hypothetical protein OXG39_07670, partial [Chloroflexi bacterium]|nr:hypothetical protein [Chloroflexota bacterium]
MEKAIDNALEKRGFTDSITEAILNAASDASRGYLAALEIAASQLGRAFAAANVTGRGAAAFTPPVLSMIGRQLVERGEAVWRRQNGRLEWISSYSLRDGSYVATLADGRTLAVAPGQVFAARWNTDLLTGLGIAPLDTARTLKSLVERLEASMAAEGNASVGYLLPVPSDGAAGNIAALKADLAKLDGRIAIVETTRAGWGAQAVTAPRRDYELMRLGPNLPQGNVLLFEQAQEYALAACGYPVQLVQRSDGTAQREAWRRYLHGTV